MALTVLALGDEATFLSTDEWSNVAEQLSTGRSIEASNRGALRDSALTGAVRMATMVGAQGRGSSQIRLAAGLRQ